MFIFIFFVLFQLILSDETNLATLKIIDGDYIAKQIEASLYDKYLPDEKFIDLNISAKIIDASSLDRFFDIINKYEGYYNNRWVIILT